MAAASQQMATISARSLRKLLFCILKGTNFRKKIMGIVSVIFIECSATLDRMNAKLPYLNCDCMAQPSRSPSVVYGG